MQGRIAVAALAAIATLALPAAAGARTKTVQAGPFGAKAKQFDAALATGNEYYRRVITIHKGDSVRWKINGPHSVTFVPRGDTPPGLAVPDLSNPVAGSTDAAGNPF
jgi:hypothetical protein